MIKVLFVIIVRYTLLLAHEGLRCMRHADVDAQYDTLHIDSKEILLRHAVDGRTSMGTYTKRPIKTTKM